MLNQNGPNKNSRRTRDFIENNVLPLKITLHKSFQKHYSLYFMPLQPYWFNPISLNLQRVVSKALPNLSYTCLILY